ncbi:MAG: GNAT family N-acetyltransferase [Deltaproteobacteria bacterium]|nr:GNAT family N-acetyltransferase [Deltaproteobacteria bacterium]
MSSARRLVTERLVISTATAQHLLVELDDPQKLGPLLGARVPGSWPPHPEDQTRLRETMARLHGAPTELGWLMRYVVLRRGPDGHAVLIGRVGLEGPAVEGNVRVYCALLPAFSGHGYGREAAGRLVDWALDHPGIERVTSKPPLAQEGWIKALSELSFRRDGDDVSDADRGFAHFVRHRDDWQRDSLALRRGASLVPQAATVPIAGIPTLAREVFDRLLREPLFDTEDLRREVMLYVDVLANAAQDNPSVDHQLGRDIGRTCEGLLIAVTQNTPEHTRRQIQAAARYFVTEEDGDSDFEIGGLDEDAAVANAVAEHLGRSDLLCDVN